MAKVRYKFNPQTLNYEKVQLTWRDRARKILSFVVVGAVFASIVLIISWTFFDSPKELMEQRELQMMRRQYKVLNEEMSQMEKVLDNVQQRDDNIYRTILEAEPIPKSVREAGVGGANRYTAMEGYKYSDQVIGTTYRLDKIEKRLYVQSKSFDEIVNLAKNKEKMLAHIPAIMPISNTDLKRMASGFGYRIDPIYKTRKFHAGMDFSAPIGTPIYATGDGVVESADQSIRGYGKHVLIDNGYGYETLFGHMSKILVKGGQKVKRGDIIGLVGNTGKSVGPHVHYEVRKDGHPVNPVNYYFNDLTPAEYDRMIELSSQAGQSFD